MTTNDINPRWLTLDMARAYAPLSEKDYKDLVASGDIYGVKRGRQGRLYIDRLSIDEYFNKERKQVKKTVEDVIKSIEEKNLKVKHRK